MRPEQHTQGKRKAPPLPRRRPLRRRICSPMAAKLRPSHGSMTSLASLFECGHVRAVETRDIRVPQARKEGKLMRELRARAAPLGPLPLPVGVVHGRCGGTGVRRALAKARAERDNPALNNPGSHQATGSALRTSHSGIAVAGEDRGVWGANRMHCGDSLCSIAFFAGLRTRSRTQGRSTLTKFACGER